MVNEEKVKIMTRLAIYEEGKGKEELPLTKYYKHDYVKYNMLKTGVSATFCYLLIVAAYVLLHAEELMENVNTLDYETIISSVVIGYLVFLIAYLIFSRFYYAWRYEKIKPNIIKYNHYLKKLNEFYEQEVDDSPKNVKERGTIDNNDEFIDY